MAAHSHLPSSFPPGYSVKAWAGCLPLYFVPLLFFARQPFTIYGLSVTILPRVPASMDALWTVFPFDTLRLPHCPSPYSPPVHTEWAHFSIFQPVSCMLQWTKPSRSSSVLCSLCSSLFLKLFVCHPPSLPPVTLSDSWSETLPNLSVNPPFSHCCQQWMERHPSLLNTQLLLSSCILPLLKWKHDGSCLQKAFRQSVVLAQKAKSFTTISISFGCNHCRTFNKKSTSVIQLQHRPAG